MSEFAIVHTIVIIVAYYSACHSNNWLISKLQVYWCKGFGSIPMLTPEIVTRIVKQKKTFLKCH